MQGMKVRDCGLISIGGGSNILLINFFLFSRDSVEFYKIHSHLRKTGIGQLIDLHWYKRSQY